MIKRRYTDPYLVVAGDFNLWAVEEALEEFLDIPETHQHNTRGNKCIDRIFSNFGEFVVNTQVHPPLESDDSLKKSDHLVVLMEAVLPRVEAFEVLRYSYRYYTEEAAEKFTRWAIMNDWASVFAATGSNAKAVDYQGEIEGAIDSCFDLITTCLLYTSPSPRD